MNFSIISDSIRSINVSISSVKRKLSNSNKEIKFPSLLDCFKKLLLKNFIFQYTAFNKHELLAKNHHYKKAFFNAKSLYWWNNSEFQFCKDYFGPSKGRALCWQKVVASILSLFLIWLLFSWQKIADEWTLPEFCVANQNGECAIHFYRLDIKINQFDWCHI